MSGLTNMTDDCKRHMRIKIRDILDRLVRKYGCDALTPHIPISDTVMYKRLRNLRKLNVRKKRMKERRKEEDDDSTYDEFVIDSKHKSVNEILADSDSEDDMEIDDELNTKSGNSKKSETWIEEDGDTIVDFTDPSARTKIIGKSSFYLPLTMKIINLQFQLLNVTINYHKWQILKRRRITIVVLRLLLMVD